MSFSLHEGEVLAIVGPSGAGKSSLLRLMNRLDEPTEGTVLLKERNTREIPVNELRRAVGMVMQRAWLFPGTVAENIAFGPAQQGISLPAEEIDTLLAHVGLAGYTSRDVSTLSGGEAQRVAITRALANRPEVLLLDEPTSALDDASREDVEALLRKLIREEKHKDGQRLTCIWITHNREQARTMADRVLAMRAGRVEALGTPAEVLR
ncbi:ABC transporter ATP-binding protein [Silvibacterium dinghuense]|uniref:ABC transporter ATP-binding protein n=1 Tax=Silvibacterium dinghuense TaxID=1560006 RepID=UPI0019577B9E|nr:ATP-binding cassette domain-containing protein [Silvibacterium dinghuense]